jgi:hypothetical protein
MILCGLCGQSKECLQKEIDGKEYDFCSDCWNPLSEKRKGKGRAQRSRDIVLLPPPRVVTEREDDEAKPLPGEPPKIWGAAVRLNLTRPLSTQPRAGWILMGGQ